MKVQAVIWDFDGVILDNELLHIEAEIATARSFGIPLTPEIASEYLGVRLDEYFRAIITRFESGVGLDELLEAHFAVLRRWYAEGFPLTPHVVEVLDRLKGVFPMGIATNRERGLLELSLARHSLAPYFKSIVCGEEVAKGKPAPDSFLRAAAQLAADPPSTAVIEDSMAGFRAAKGAGMLLIARMAAHNRHLDFSCADFVVEDLRSIPRILEAPSRGRR